MRHSSDTLDSVSIDELNHDIAQEANANRVEHYQEQLKQVRIGERFDDDDYLHDAFCDEDVVEVVRDLRNMIPVNYEGIGLSQADKDVVTASAIRLIDLIEEKLGGMSC